MDNLTAVISPKFCSRNQVHLTIVRNSIVLRDGCKYSTHDEKGHHMFDVKEKLWSMHGRHVLLDPESNLIATFKKKIFSANKKWQVFEGDGSQSTDLLFTANNTSPAASKIEVEVFLAGNKMQQSWDFKVVGSWLERSCVVYNDHYKPIAQMQKKQRGKTILGKDTFLLTVNPKVDYAFIVALIVILCEFKEDRED